MMVRYVLLDLDICNYKRLTVHQTIKFRSQNESPTITQQDTTVSSIKSLISTTSKQAEGLERKITELNNVAKVALSNKNRISALSALRSKKLAEHNLSQRLDVLTQLEEVYTSIERAAGQVDIVQAMEAGADVLRSLHTEIGGTDKVEKVVEDMREEMAKTDDIASIINEAAGPTVDETEIDNELEAMEGEEQEGKEEKEVEETMKRLAELDKAAKKAIHKPETTPAQDVESDLTDSIGKLSDMSIEENPTNKEPQVPQN